MSYYGKLTKRVVKEYYEFTKGSLHPKYKDRDRIINKALEAAVGATEYIKIYKVTVTVWESDKYETERGIVRESTWKELAVAVAPRTIKGTGGWVDYED